MIVQGISGLPRAQARHREDHPRIDPLDAWICQGATAPRCCWSTAGLPPQRLSSVLLGRRAPARCCITRSRGDPAGPASPPDTVTVVGHGFDYDRRRRAWVLSQRSAVMAESHAC